MNFYNTETYVKSEFLYHRITRKGSYDEEQLGNWTAYLDQFRSFIEKGFQFTRLAVQEPYGVMVLQVTNNQFFILKVFAPTSMVKNNDNRGRKIDKKSQQL